MRITFMLNLVATPDWASIRSNFTRDTPAVKRRPA